MGAASEAGSLVTVITHPASWRHQPSSIGPPSQLISKPSPRPEPVEPGLRPRRSLAGGSAAGPRACAFEAASFAVQIRFAARSRASPFWALTSSRSAGRSHSRRNASLRGSIASRSHPSAVVPSATVASARPARWLSERARSAGESSISASGAPSSAAAIITDSRATPRHAATAAFPVQRPSRQSSRRLGTRSSERTSPSCSLSQRSCRGTSPSSRVSHPSSVTARPFAADPLHPPLDRLDQVGAQLGRRNDRADRANLDRSLDAMDRVELRGQLPLLFRMHLIPELGPLGAKSGSLRTLSCGDPLVERSDPRIAIRRIA